MAALLPVGGPALARAQLPVPPLAEATADRTFLHTAWTADDGLPQSSPRRLEQTRDGYLWIGTFQGLARFDGVRFTVFEAAATEGLDSDRISGLLEDREGNLWVGTETGGLSRYREGRFTAFTTADGLPGNEIRRLYEDRVGNVWVQTGLGPAQLEERDGKPAFTYEEGRPAQEDVLAICEDATDRGTFWVGTRDALVRVRDGRRTAYTAADGMAFGAISVLLQSQDGTLWILSDQGVSRLRDGRFTPYPIPGGGHWSALLEDRDAALWAVGEGQGLYRFDGRRFVPVVLPDNPIGNLTISILEDREGSLWIGTNGNGLHRLRRRLFAAIGLADGLPGTMVHGIYEDRTGALWAATAGSGLVRIQDGLVRVYTVRDGLPSDFVWTFAEDGDGYLWAGTSRGPARRDGLRFEQQAGASEMAASGISDHTHALALGPTGDLWLSAWQGVSRYREGQLTRHSRVVPEDFVISLFEAPSGTLWLGTRDSGLCRLEGAQRTCYTTDDGLSHNTVRAVYPAGGDALWLGTYGGGLCQFEDSQFEDGQLEDGQLEDERFKCLTKQHGLPDGTVHHVLEDDFGYVWLSSNKGVFRLARQELESFFQGVVDRVYPDVFGKVDGMPSSECNGGFQPAGLRAADGRLWFPTTQGLAVVDPARAAAWRELSAPPVHVEQVSVDNVPVSTATDVVLAPHSDRLVIEYTAPYLAVPEKMRFRYRLEGHDEHWIEAGQVRRAIYTSLPPGTYGFRVQAAVGHGTWNETRAPLTITRRPHFYETAWFYTVCALLLVLIGYGGYWIRAQRARASYKRLQRLNTQLNREIAERQRAEAKLETKNVELATKNEELEWRNTEVERFTYTLSHDLKTPLVTIKGFLGLLEKDAIGGNVDAMRRDLTFIDDATDKMVRLLNELLELSRIGRLPLPAERIPLAELVQEAVRRSAGQIAARGVTVEVATRMPVVVGERARLLEVYHNLIDNAVRFMGDQGEPRIEIGARREDGEVRCYVRDNGIGVDPLYHEKIFDLFDQLNPDGDGTGIGLALVKRIVETHDGSISVESDGTGQGSTFYFTLPHEDASGSEGHL